MGVVIRNKTRILLGTVGSSILSVMCFQLEQEHSGKVGFAREQYKKVLKVGERSNSGMRLEDAQKVWMGFWWWEIEVLGISYSYWHIHTRILRMPRLVLRIFQVVLVVKLIFWESDVFHTYFLRWVELEQGCGVGYGERRAGTCFNFF